MPAHAQCRHARLRLRFTTVPPTETKTAAEAGSFGRRVLGSSAGAAAYQADTMPVSLTMLIPLAVSTSPSTAVILTIAAPPAPSAS